MAKSFGEVLLLGSKNLEDIRTTPMKWGLTSEETKDVFAKNPLLFFNYPYDVMPLKRKILKYLNFTAEMGKFMLLNNP